nr:tetratricopeptide repeat protein [Bacillus sonorensis]
MNLHINQIEPVVVKRIIGVIYHNLGLVSFKGQKLTEAESFFRKALNMKEHAVTIYGIRTQYMLSRVLYQTDKLEEARSFYNIALNRALECNEEEYKSKLKIIYSIFEEYNNTEVEQSLNYLEKKRLWSEYAELAEILGDYHFEKGNFAEGRNYLKRAINAQTQIFKVTEAL